MSLGFRVQGLGVWGVGFRFWGFRVFRHCFYGAFARASFCINRHYGPFAHAKFCCLADVGVMGALCMHGLRPMGAPCKAWGRWERHTEVLSGAEAVSLLLMNCHYGWLAVSYEQCFPAFVGASAGNRQCRGRHYQGSGPC